MPSSNATRNKRRKQKHAQETLQEKEQRRLEHRQKYAARYPETIESQRKRRNEKDRQTYAAMDKDEKLREILKCECANLNCGDKHHPRLKQRITNLILTNDQFKYEFIKKTDSNPRYSTKWMDKILSIESKLYMHKQGLYAT
jgi:lysyl-tRNA synthetase class I